MSGYMLTLLMQEAGVSTSGSNDLLAKCVYSVFSHYYPQYDPCTKELMAEILTPAQLHRKIIDRMWKKLARVSSCFPKEVISCGPAA